jgi:hypothetical protein
LNAVARPWGGLHGRDDGEPGDRQYQEPFHR